MMASPAAHRLALLLTVAGLTPLLADGASGADAQTTQFRSGVEVVLIDVSVIDKKGTPVDGLGPDDFTVVVDGVPRHIVSAQFINHHGPAVAPPPAQPVAGTAPTPPPDPEATAPIRGRDVLIVIDEDSLETGDGLLAKRAASGFVDKLGPADRVGLATIPRLRSSLTLSPDHALTKKAIADWVPGAAGNSPSSYWIGVSEAFEIERNDPMTIQRVIGRECRTDSRGRSDASCGRDVVQEARQMASRAHTRGTQSLDALRTIGRGLRQVDGPKTMVLVSGGILTPESMSSFSAVERELAAAQVMLYALYFEKTAYSASRVNNSPSLLEDDRIEADGLANVTAAAGGTLLNIIGTVEPYFERVATELSASYLLGINVAPADHDGKAHRVQVKVGRAGLEVRSRKQYIIPSEKPAVR